MKHLLFIFILSFFLVGCKSPEPRKPLATKSGSFIKESLERNKKLNKAESERIESLIASTPDKKFQTSENGFWYSYTTKIEEDSPTAEFGNKLEFEYSVSDLKNNNIYTEEQLGLQTYYMDKEELFQGLREGLKLMKAGEEVTFIFPSQKAFGYYGDGNKIGTNVPLIVNVNLKTITQNND
ncbi:MAG: gliding motility-associated peptidyl-prolyl isomerase GldI [Psychroserpens sp.]|nr:gliding motility-associated peptidyl-prolyl isomerase GldI [Psychroserpens sp.]